MALVFYVKQCLPPLPDELGEARNDHKSPLYPILVVVYCRPLIFLVNPFLISKIYATHVLNDMHQSRKNLVDTGKKPMPTRRSNPMVSPNQIRSCLV